MTGPRDTPPTDPDALAEQPPQTTSRYDRVTDLLAGPSRRLFDNLVSLGGFVVGAGIGIPVAYSWNLPIPDYAIIGCGVIAGGGVGILLSGGFLMVYRWFRH
ncbi:MAG: hypothetical protein GY911_15965 [Actinomycetales bacterium]|nr:hypothetical protein [Actinomycetales bacterium]